MRLIDADALEQELFDADWMLDNDEHMVEDILRKQPTIDAVTVVRCKECVHSAKLEGYHQRRLKNGLNCNACRGDNGYGIAKLSLTTPDGYCDYGLRRSGNAND